MEREEDVFLIKGEELAKWLKEKYKEGRADGYNAAKKKLAVEKGSTDEWKESKEGVNE